MSTDEITKPKGPGIPYFRFLFVVCIIMLIIMKLEWIGNNAIFFGIVALFLWLWTKSKKNGWLGAAMLCLIALIMFGMNHGESWYINYKTLPWFWGLEKNILAESTGFGPVLLLILGVIGASWAIYFVGTPSLDYANSKPGLKTKIPALLLGVLVIAISFHASITGGAYLNKTYESRYGTILVGATTKLGSDFTAMLSRVFDETADEMNAVIELKMNPANKK